jgi:hypothetical protein
MFLAVAEEMKEEDEGGIWLSLGGAQTEAHDGFG